MYKRLENGVPPGFRNGFDRDMKKLTPLAVGTVFLLAACAAAVAFVAAPTGRAASNDPNDINCPAAPSGWSASAVTKHVVTPQSVPNAQDPNTDNETYAQGGNAVSVSCTYRHSAAKLVSVTVSYALPADANPASDFELGCGTGSVSWNGSTRVYRASSLREWAIATLDDAYGSLAGGDVPRFENVTRQLLQNAQAYGHSCSLAAKQTGISSRVYFDILVAGANLKDTFYTSQSGKAGVSPITQISGLTAALPVKTSAGTHVLTIKLTRGIDYRSQTPHAAGQARFHVVVTASKVPACRKGATGTLTISTKPVIVLAVCGQTFLPGPAPPVHFNN